MRPDEHARMFEFEDHYWWFVGRQAVIRALLDRHLRPVPDRTILDVGCGSGATLKVLEDYGYTIGLDPYASAIALSKQRGLTRLVVGDATRLPYPAESFDLVTALDVMEHIEDDVAALGEVHRVLKPNGQMLLTVPAYQWLWSQHDIALDHFRRYTASLLKQRVKAAGFIIERLTYCISLLLPAAAALRLSERYRKPKHGPQAALIELPKPLNAFCLATVQLEASLLRYINLPAGVSVVCLARRL